MSDIAIRRATAADLLAVNDIFYEEETRGEPDPPLRRMLGYYAHVLRAGELYVTERAGTVLGFSGRILRGDVSFLTDLFVRPEVQSSRIGAALLRAALPDDGGVRCTYASSDHRALSLYTRAGMQPRYPQCGLRAAADRIRPLGATAVTLGEAAPTDPELARWDAEICGRHRPQEFAYWLDECDAVSCWLRRGDRTVGYAVLQRRSDGAIWHPEACTVGPLGVRERADAVPAVLAAVEWARVHCPTVRIFLPGPHPALAPLLDAGLRITYVDTYCSSAATPIFDPTRYVSSFDLF